MTTIPQLPVVPQVGAADLLPLSQDGILYAATVEQLVNGLQAEISLPSGDLLGRVSLGSGTPEAVNIGVGLFLTSSSLSANGKDHATFPVQTILSLTDQVVITAEGEPALLQVAALRELFSAGTGVTIDSNGVIGVTLSAVAGPAGEQGPIGPAGPQGVVGPQGMQGAGLAAPSTSNSVNSLSGSDSIAIWQNGANRWITYQQLIGGQTIDQLPSAGPAQDSDQILVAQGSNSLSSQSFSTIWTYVANKLPTTKKTIVELTTNTVLDSTSHNGRVLVASQPLTLSANFANMGAGFSCRLINLSSGAVTMGAGITPGSKSNVLSPGAEAVLTGLTYSGGSLVWWSGTATITPSLTVAFITSPIVSTPFSVSGTFYNDVPSSLDYSLDGTTWTTVLLPIINLNNYTFQAPGLSAGTYAVHVRDHNNVSVAGVSNSFTIVNSSIIFSSVPNSASVGVVFQVAGTVTPANAAVQIGFSSSASAPPTSFAPAVTVSGNWSASIVPQASGTAFLWAEQVNNPGIETVSSAISVGDAALTVNAPSSVIAGQTFTITGTVTPAGSPVTVQILSQNISAPNSSGDAATVAGTNFSATLTAATSGTIYVWAQDQAANLAAVSGAITVTAQFSITYTINQPGVTAYSRGSGTVAVNGSVNPPQNIATQAALSTSNTSPPATGWQPASIIDNNALWALYLTIPAVPGSYYVWVETTSGTSPAVSPFTLSIT